MLYMFLKNLGKFLKAFKSANSGALANTSVY